MKSRVHNPKYLEKYFTQFPNIIDDSDLTPYEYRLLIHYYRVGECWEGVRKTSEICKMSTGMVAKCRLSLEQKGFIEIYGNGDGIIINLVDLSKNNLEKYSMVGVHAVDSTVHVVNTNRSCGEHKNNQFKKNHLRITPESEDSVPKSLFNTENNSVENKEKKEIARDEFFVSFTGAWCEAYPELGFNAVSGKKIKSLIEHTKRWIKASGKEVTPEVCKNMFVYVLAYVKRVGHFAHGKPITTFDSQYLSIIHEIKHGKSTPGKKQSAFDYINNL